MRARLYTPKSSGKISALPENIARTASIPPLTMATPGLVLGHLLALAGLLLAGLAAGWPVARWLSRRGPVPLGLTLAVGFASVAQALLLLGMVGALRPVVLETLLVVLLGAAACSYSLTRPRGADPAGELRPPPWRRPFEPAVLLLLAAPAFALTLYPPLGFDQTMYHLPFTQAFARTGGLPLLPDLRFPVFPQLAEVLSTPLLLFAGDAATQLVGLAALGASAALAYAWARDTPSAAAGLAPAFLAGSPAVLYLSTCGYVEPVLALFGLGALYAAERSRRNGSSRWALAAGFLAGSAAGVKYLGILYPAAAALLLLRREGMRAAVVRFGAFAAATGLALLPSYGRIVHLTGNPLFPFYPALFGGSPWAADAFLGARGTERWSQAVTLLWDLVFRRAAVGELPPYSPLLTVALPLALVGAVRQPAMRRPLAAALAFWLLSPTHAHYFAGFAPLWGVLVAVGVGALLETSPRRLAAIGLALALVGPAWALRRIVELGPPPATPEARERFLGVQLPMYRALRAATADAAGAAVYGIGTENLMAFRQGPLLGDFNGPASIDRLTRRIEATGSLAAALDELGVRNFLVGRRSARWLAEAQGDPRLVPIYQDEHGVVFRVRGAL